MSRQSVWSSKSVLNSVIACLSIRPLRMNTVNLLRAAVSILKVIDRPVDQRCASGCTAPHSLHPSTDHKQCNRVANWISVKTELKVELGVTES